MEGQNKFIDSVNGTRISFFIVLQKKIIINILKQQQ